MSSHHHSGKPRPAAAVGSKTARPCDSCIRRRARWFCAADDAFLCHPCDSFVHSANPLARRHHRLPLPSSSHKPPAVKIPSWHHGFKRKPRTPRSHHKPLVPEIENSVEDEEEEEEEKKLLFCVPVFEPTEIDLAEFAADMESLLGREEEFCMEELGLGERKEVEVEVKEEEKGENLGRETMELEKVVCKGMGLRLDYEAVKEAWTMTGSSPWMAGERPRVGVEDYWLECLGMWGGTGGELMGGVVGGGIQVMDVGREARVTRYREKRRTRLFSKKIRYEVRKLNAEKRPRMKGRFVKRASFPATIACGGGGGGPVAFSY